MKRRPSLRNHGALCQLLYAAQQGLCFHCLQPMTAGRRNHRRKLGWTRDHVIPRSAGGKHMGNMVLAHHRCNSQRADSPLPAIEIRRARLIIAAVQVKMGRGFPLPPCDAEQRRNKGVGHPTLSESDSIRRSRPVPNEKPPENRGFPGV